MKTIEDISAQVYAKVNASTLASSISGEVRKRRRDPKSTKEDVIVSKFTGNYEQTQEFIGYVNIYVPYKNNNPDTARLRTLAAVAASVLEFIQIDDHCCLRAESQETSDLDDIQTSVIIIKVKSLNQ